MSIFTGAGVAIITPMNEDGTVNYAKLEEILEFQIAGHTDAIIICGTTGEASTLSDEEHLECIRFTCEKEGKQKNSCHCRNRIKLHRIRCISFKRGRKGRS